MCAELRFRVTLEAACHSLGLTRLIRPVTCVEIALSHQPPPEETTLYTHSQGLKSVSYTILHYPIICLLRMAAPWVYMDLTVFNI